ncbi:F-actin-capping protein subunit alpha [Entamoeba marina]
MADYSEVTKIVTSFLKDSPPGEFNNVLKDCRELAQDDSIFEACLPTCLHDYNTEQLTIALDGSNSAIICKETERSPSEFIDPVNKKVVTFDHLTKQVTSVQPLSNSLPGREGLTKALQTQLSKYAAEFYPKGYAIVVPKSDSTYSIIISAADFKAANFSNGKWRSEWTVEVGGKANCTGRLRVQVHYFEDANIQMHTDINKKVTANTGSDEQTAQNVIREIRTAEENFHSELDKVFATLSDNCLKALRRPLPISKQKINWANWGSHKMLK